MTTTLAKQLSVQDNTTFAQLAQKLHADRDNMQTLMFRRVINGTEIIGYLPFRLVSGEPMVRALRRGLLNSGNYVVDCSPAGETADKGINFGSSWEAIHPSVSQPLVDTRQALVPFADFIAHRQEKVERDWIEGSESQLDQGVPAVHRIYRDIPVLAYLDQLGMTDSCSLVPLEFIDQAVGHPFGLDDWSSRVRGDVSWNGDSEETRGYPFLQGEELHRGDVIDSWAPAKIIDDPVLITRPQTTGRGAWKLHTERIFDGLQLTSYVLDSTSRSYKEGDRWSVGSSVELVERNNVSMQYVRTDDFDPIWTEVHRDLIGEHVAAREARQ